MRVDGAPNSDAGSPVADSAAPILQSEYVDLFDEDAPEYEATGRGVAPKQGVSSQGRNERTYCNGRPV